MTTSQPRGQKRNLAEASAEDALLVQDGADPEMRSVGSCFRAANASLEANIHHITARNPGLGPVSGLKTERLLCLRGDGGGSAQ